MADKRSLLGAEFVKSLRREIQELLSHCTGGRSSGTIPFLRDNLMTTVDFILINPDLVMDEDDGSKDWDKLLEESKTIVDQWRQYRKNKRHRHREPNYCETSPPEEQELFTRWRAVIEIIYDIRSEERVDIVHNENDLVTRLIRLKDAIYYNKWDDPTELIAAVEQIPVDREFEFVVDVTTENPDFGVWDMEEPQYSLYKVIWEKTTWTYETSFDNEDCDDLWRSEEQILRECQRVFLRLTERPDGSFVDLWDLIDERPPAKKETAYQVIKAILRETCASHPPPVEYDPMTGVFTKGADTFEVIRSLQKAFLEWGGRGKK